MVGSTLHLEKSRGLQPPQKKKKTRPTRKGLPTCARNPHSATARIFPEPHFKSSPAGRENRTGDTAYDKPAVSQARSHWGTEPPQLEFEPPKKKFEIVITICNKYCDHGFTD